MSAQSNAPIIVKRKKIVAGGGHHGGAWKVAYADFVTAMMAFFMLMWLLNATTEKQRKGIADYFNPTIPINRISGGGEGSFGGTNIFAEQVLAQNGTGATQSKPSEEFQARGDSGRDDSDTADDKGPEDAALREIEEALTGRSGESLVSDDLLEHIVTRVTDDGLIVELFDTPRAALFEPGTDTPTELGTRLSEVVAGLFALVPNRVAIEGHVAAVPVIVVENRVWDLSGDRARRMRMLLEAGGLAPDRLRRITGHADRAPVLPDKTAPRNNRLEVILLRNEG